MCFDAADKRLQHDYLQTVIVYYNHINSLTVRHILISLFLLSELFTGENRTADNYQLASGRCDNPASQLLIVRQAISALNGVVNQHNTKDF